MQTFLPFPDFVASLRCLDYRRLGKQRVEARQILTAIEKVTGWSRHPAVRMWRGYTPALTYYGNLAIVEWVARGYRNNMPLLGTPHNFDLPPWFGDEAFHRAHQSKLVFKDPRHYKFDVPNDLDYVWPDAV